jgi:hypothetical protein
MFLRELGLNPAAMLSNVISLACFYLGAVALAFAATAYSLWRHTGGGCGGLGGVYGGVVQKARGLAGWWGRVMCRDLLGGGKAAAAPATGPAAAPAGTADSKGDAGAV